MTLIEGEEITQPPQGTLCNRTACKTSHNVVCWNTSTREWYCISCAKRINAAAEYKICFLVDLL
jgi:hypothetical protein